MSVTRLILATLGAMVVYFALGGLVFGLSPLRHEFAKYPAVYRPAEAIKRVMPVGMLAMLISMLALVALYALTYHAGSGIREGARFGALVGVYALGSFVLHNHVNLNIGWRLTIGQAVAYFIQWTLVGIVVGAIYQPVV